MGSPANLCGRAAGQTMSRKAVRVLPKISQDGELVVSSAAFRTDNHVFSFTTQVLLAFIYLSVMLEPLVACSTTCHFRYHEFQEAKRSSPVHARTNALRPVPYRLPSPRLPTNSALQLPPCETDGRPIPPPNRRHGPEAHSTRRRSASLPRPTMGGPRMGRRA